MSVFLPCLRSQSWLYIFSMSKKPVLNLVTKWTYLFICLQSLQSEPLICVPDVSARLTISMLVSMYEGCSVISATYALFTYGHEMLVQSFWYHFGTLGTIYDLLYSNYAITLLLYQPTGARINCLEECADCWDLSFSCIIVLPPSCPKFSFTWQNKINLPVYE